MKVSDFTENECINSIRSVVELLTLGIQLAMKRHCVRSQDLETGSWCLLWSNANDVTLLGDFR